MFPASTSTLRASLQLCKIVPDDYSKTYDMHDVIEQIVDDGEYFEIKDEYAKNIITCFCRFNGRVAGLVANNPKHPGSMIEINSCDKYYRFLQILDDGRLTDGLGRVVDFSNAIIIATSNAHSKLIQMELARGTKIPEMGAILTKRLIDFFKPELINRFSRVVVFRSLSVEELQEVVKLNLGELASTISKTQAISIYFDESAVRLIAKLGFDPIYGARPLRRAINEHLRSRLANMILKGEISRGQTISIGTNNEEFIFENR